MRTAQVQSLPDLHHRGVRAMSDPAVEAAQRAWLSRGVPTKFAIVDLADAAREALKPIRERHQQVCIYAVGRVCKHDGHRWPCADALDAYSTEELNAMMQTQSAKAKE